MDRPDTCPDENVIAALVSGDATPKEIAEIEGHLDRCHGCLDLVAAAAVAEHEALPPAIGQGTVLVEGALVTLVTKAWPRAERQTAAARIVETHRVGVDDRAFTARSVDGRTRYRGWISTFYYEGEGCTGPLCGRGAAASSETFLHVAEVG